MVDVIVGKAGHGKVTVVVVRLFPDIDALLLADRLGRVFEILREELSLLVEVVAGAL